MTASQLLAASVLVALALPAAGAAEAPTRRTPFTHFGADAAIELRGDGASASLAFGNRLDELVTRATLHFRYTYSPALAPGASAIRITLNDEPVGTLAVSAKGAGEPVEADIEIDPRLIVGDNRLQMSLVAARGEGAEAAERPGLWAEVSGASELGISYEPLAVADELANLPEPFFDRRDQRRVVVPFVFAPQPSIGTLTAAAVVASWLGKISTWRGVRFPVRLERPAAGHSIAFVANDERPAFLASVPPAKGPELRLTTNPADGRSKLLLVMGRNAAELKAAAEVLVLGAAKLSGAAASVKPVELPVRAAYDAPAWVSLSRPVKLAELLEWPKQLETAGGPPALPTVRADLRLPPDLATWRGPGVPLALVLQYNPGACTREGRFEVAVNGDPLVVTPLRAGTNAELTERREFYVPAHRLRTRMRLQFTFRFVARQAAECSDDPPTLRAAVSADSTIDFSGFPHYAQMPNLNHFATAGYPFTKFADLSQTVVVLPDRPVAADIEAMLGLLGRMGEATGYPATRVRLATPRDESLLAEADLLVIGATPQQSLLVRWSNELPVMLTGYGQRVPRATPTRLAAVEDWLGIGQRSDAPRPSPILFEGGGPIATVFGFESPLSAGRSVVAVTAVAPEQVLRVLEALEDRDRRQSMRGDVAFVLPGKVMSALVGRIYEVGFMPPWTGAGYWLTANPVALGGLVVAGLLLAFVIAWWAHARVTARRGRGVP